MSSGQGRTDSPRSSRARSGTSSNPGRTTSSDNRSQRDGSPNPYSTASISQLPSLPWNRPDQTAIVAHFSHFSLRFFRGETGRPEQDRSRPAGFLLSYIPTRFQGSHLPSAMERMAYLQAEMPQLTPGTVKLFRQAAQVAANQGDRQTWLTATIRAIEYGTAELVLDYVQGIHGRSISPRARAIQRDLQAAITVLESTDSEKRLAICYICALAISLTQRDYDQVPERLRKCIELLGSAFGMQDAAKQLTSGLVSNDDESWISTQSSARHMATAGTDSI